MSRDRCSIKKKEARSQEPEARRTPALALASDAEVAGARVRDNRRYPARPILGVGAIILDRDRVLLVERGRPPLAGYWSLPGGVLEVGERLEDGIRREVREETGLAVQPLGVVEIFERIMPDQSGRPEYHYVLIDYLCRVLGGTLCAADDSRRAEWVPRRKLDTYRITEGTVPVIEKAFRNRAKYKR